MVRRAKWAAAVVAVLVAASCTGDDRAPDQTDAVHVAGAFIEAWSERDFDAMVEMFESDREWSSARLSRWMTRTLAKGAITDYRVELGGNTQEPGGEVSEVSEPYEISYESDAATETVELQGQLELTRDSPEEEWVPQWEESMLWPGIEGAAGFDVANRWPPRAPIVDREGRMIARGPADQRRYPFGSVAGSVIGHIEPLSRGAARDRGLEPGALVGGSGLEEAFEQLLAGSPASKLRAVDSDGRPLEVLGSTRAQKGRRLKASLDIEVQRVATAAYGATTGGAAVIDPRTGDMLAAVASGPFDPNNYVGVSGINPFNRALVGLYPPGSSMKVVTAAAALEERVVRPESMLSGPKEYKGVRNFESGEFGSIPFSSAVKFSVNTAFAQVAEELGARRMSRYAEGFGFNRAPDIPLEVATSSFPPPEGLGDLMWASIGQAQVVATPLEMATVAATIANAGKRMELRIDMAEDPRGERVVSRRTAAQLTQMMEDVVAGGTGSAARVTGLRIAGKTGTAEVQVNGKIKNHGWFICFAPVEKPRVAVAVVSELGGIGGQVAAPLARQILVSVLPLVQ